MTKESKTKDHIKKWDYGEKVWRYVAPTTGTRAARPQKPVTWS